MRFRKHLNEGIFDKIFGGGKGRTSDLTNDDIWNIARYEEERQDDEKLLKAINDPRFYTMKDNLGNTPFHILVEKINLNDHDDRVFNILYTHPQIAKVKNKRGDTPLHVLADRYGKDKHPDIQNLYRHKYISSVKNNAGQTPLHILAEKGCKDIKYADGFDSIKDNINGETPLHYLARYIARHGTKEDIEEFKHYPGIRKVKSKIGATPAIILGI